MKTCSNEDCPGRGESGKAVEYVDWVSACAECGASLVAPAPLVSEEVESTDEAWDAPPLVEATRYFDPGQAYLAADRLKAEGIEALVDDRSFSVFSAASGGRPQIRLLVAEADVEQSRTCLSMDHRMELDTTPEATLPPIASEPCPRCGSEDFYRRRRGLSWLGRLGIVAVVVATALYVSGSPGVAFVLGLWLLFGIGLYFWPEGLSWPGRLGIVAVGVATALYVSGSPLVALVVGLWLLFEIGLDFSPEGDARCPDCGYRQG